MSSQLHVYVGPFIESPYPTGDGDPFDAFERKHRGALSYHRLGYKPDSLLAWLPNDHRRKYLEFVSLDRTSNPCCLEIDQNIGVTLLSAFKSAYWAEIETVRALIPGAVVRFGVVAYYL